MRPRGLLLALLAVWMPSVSRAQENTLRIFTWSGYVTEEDIKAVNKLLEADGNPVRAEIIKPWAEGPEQMFDVLRAGNADLSFLTLNYIQMQNGRIGKLLQPIDTASPRIPNYKYVLPALKAVPMGLSGTRPLYVPFGGGAYGIWANARKVKKADQPRSIKDLLAPQWKGHLSLTKGQIQPNIAMATMALGKRPFQLNDLVVAGKSSEALTLAASDGELQKLVNGLYAQVGTFWGAVPEFSDSLWLVACYGPEIADLRAKGEDWQLVTFAEGNTVWLDTMNIAQGVKGKKLEAAEVFINYFLSPNVQNRVVNGLSMVAVTSNVKNPLIEANPNFFDASKFWPPYDRTADDIMRHMSAVAMSAAKK